MISEQAVKPQSPPPLKLPRLQGKNADEFLEKYVLKRKPVIIEDAIDAWPALNKWTPAFFIEKYGDREVTIDETSYRLGEVIQMAVDSDAETPAPYYRNVSIKDDYPELVADISPYPQHCTPNWFHSPLFLPVRNRVAGIGNYELFVGGAGRSFPFLHYDSPGADTFIHQIAGRKKFILFAPEDSSNLYPGAGNSFNVSEIENIEAVDLQKYPLYARATRYEDEAGPGDTLFMPSGWWHTATMLSFSISLGIDVANRANWKQITGFMRRKSELQSPLLRVPYLSYLHLVGSMLKLTQR